MSETWRMPWWNGAITSRSSPSPWTVLQERLSTGASPSTASGRRPNICPSSTATRRGRMRCRSWTPGFGARSGTSRSRPSSTSCMLTTGASARPSVRPVDAGIPVVLTQHDYSHVCATKRLMRGDARLSGPGADRLRPLRVVVARAGRRPGRRAANALEPPHPHQTRGRVHPGQLSRRRQHQTARTELLYASSPTSFPTSSSSTRPTPHPDGPIVFVGDLSRDKGIEVLLEAHRRLGGLPRPRAGRKGVRQTRRSNSRIRWSCAGCSITPRSSTSCRRPVWSPFPPSCPTAVRRWSSRQWPSGGRSLRLQVVGSSTWWTTASRDSWWPPATPSPCPLRSRRSSATATPRRRWGERHSNGHGPSPHRSVVGQVETLYERLLSGLPPAN